MSKVAVVYWSGTGNTEAMANAVADGVLRLTDGGFEYAKKIYERHTIPTMCFTALKRHFAEMGDKAAQPAMAQ